MSPHKKLPSKIMRTVSSKQEIMRSGNSQLTKSTQSKKDYLKKADL